MSGLCIQIRWHSSRRLTLTLRDADERFQELVLESGGEIALSADIRRCVGVRLPGQTRLTPCPASTTLGRGSQCPNCFTRSAILPCLRCTGERCGNPLRRSHCVAPDNHYCYLAIVAPGLTKVGVARVERIRERLGEQGFRHAIALARLDGREVRLWEHRIAKLGISDRLALPEKLAGWCNGAPTGQLEEELANMAAAIARRLQGPFLDQPLTFAMPELAPLPHLPRLVRIDEAGLRGQLLALYGTALLVEHEHGETVAVDADSLVGLELRQLDASEHALGQLALQL